MEHQDDAIFVAGLSLTSSPRHKQTSLGHSRLARCQRDRLEPTNWLRVSGPLQAPPPPPPPSILGFNIICRGSPSTKLRREAHNLFGLVSSGHKTDLIVSQYKNEYCRLVRIRRCSKGNTGIVVLWPAFNFDFRGGSGAAE